MSSPADNTWINFKQMLGSNGADASLENTNTSVTRGHLTSTQLGVVVHAFTGTYGVNYGRIADNLPPPETVAVLLKAAKIKNIRIYDADHGVLKAFNGSGIEIIVGLGNEFLKDISVYPDKAVEWMKQNVQPFLGTDIKGIAVGNEISGGSDVELWEVLVATVKNVYHALNQL